MRTDFGLFPARLSEACQARGVSQPKLAASIGLSPWRSIALKLTAPGALDLYRVCQIADILDVSLDWLTGRSNVMGVLEMLEPAPPKKRAKKRTA